MGLSGVPWDPLGFPGTLWDPLRGSQRVPEEELKSEFNRKVARPLFRGRGGQIFVGDSLAISQQSACQQINILRYVDSRCIDCQLLYPPYFSNCAPPSEPIVALATTKWPWCSPPHGASINVGSLLRRMWWWWKGHCGVIGQRKGAYNGRV